MKKQSKHAMPSRGKGITAAEVMTRLMADPEWVARREQEEAERQRRTHELQLAQAPLVAALYSAGYEVASVWDLVNTATPYPHAIGVLVEHLQRPYPPRIREGIARALAVREASTVLPVLIRLYKAEREPRVKEGLAVAVSGASDKDSLPEVIALASDRQHGPSRVLLLGALTRSRDPRAMAALEAMASDPELAKEVNTILRRRKRR